MIIVAIDSFKGCLPFGILEQAKCYIVPVCLLAGCVSDGKALLEAGFERVECINPVGLPLSEAIKPDVAKKNLAAMASEVVKHLVGS